MITGVYKITYINKPELFYIGSSSVSIAKRFGSHKSKFRLNGHHSKHMQSIWNKHGSEAFLFETIEYCSPDTVLQREQYWIDTLRPKFNTYPVTGSPKGFSRGIEFSNKISKIRKEKFASGQLVAFNKRKVIRSDGIIFDSITEAVIGSNTTKMVVSHSCKGRSTPSCQYKFQYLDKYIDWDVFYTSTPKRHPKSTKIICIETGNTYESISLAAKSFGKKDHSKLAAHLRGERKSFCGYTFEHYKDNKNAK